MRLAAGPTPSSRRVAFAVAGAVTALMASAPAAGAATTISRSGDQFTLRGDAAADEIAMRPESGHDTFVRFMAEPGSSLTPGPGCRAVRSRILARQTVTCGRIQSKRPETSMKLTATLGAGDDSLRAFAADDRYPRFVVDAGEGNDEVVGTVLSDDVMGGPGDDDIHGQADIDNLRGDAGNDIVFGDGDADHVVGGPGRDELNGDGRDGPTSYLFNGVGGDTVDSTDFPTDLTGLTAEQILAIAPEVDTVTCGPGLSDVATADPIDAVSPTCEVRLTPGTVLPPTSPVFPFTQTVTHNPGQRLSDLLRGEPLRFAVTPSVGSLVSAKLTISASDARRLGLGRGADARTLATLRPVLVAAGTPASLFVRIKWSARAALRGERNLRVTVAINANHTNETQTAAIDTPASTTFRLGR